MVLEQNDVVLLSHRRMFQHDEARYFLGRALASDGALIKVEGYSIVRDVSNGEVVKKTRNALKSFPSVRPATLPTFCRVKRILRPPTLNRKTAIQSLSLGLFN